MVADSDCRGVCRAGDGVFVGDEYDAAAVWLDGVLGAAWWIDFLGVDRDAVSGWTAVSFDVWNGALAAAFD